MELTQDLLAKWAKLKADLAKIKDSEMTLRKAIAEVVLAGKTKGTSRRIVDDFEVKAVGKLNANIDEAELRALWSDLSQEERKALKWKPELKMREYNALPKDSKLRSIVTFKPGAPTLELKPLNV